MSLPKEIRGDVTFENVSFSYDKENPLIKNFNINVKSGETVAIVGPTGRRQDHDDQSPDALL